MNVEFIMASSSTAPTTQLVPYKFQGKPKKSQFFDAHAKIRNIKLGHIDWNSFVTICNNPHNWPDFITKMIVSGLVNVAAHPVLVQSSKLIMAITQHYVLDEKIVQAITSEMALDIWPDAIERVFHLLVNDLIISISYDGASRWYREHQEEADELIQKRYLI